MGGVVPRHFLRVESGLEKSPVQTRFLIFSVKILFLQKRGFFLLSSGFVRSQGCASAKCGPQNADLGALLSRASSQQEKDTQDNAPQRIGQ